jgi:hypothetical protein
MQVHRFRDNVAVSIGNRTRYLSADQALDFARAIERAAREIQAGVAFVDSTVGTWSDEQA